MQKNVFEEIIEECCSNPITGFYRDGFCNTDDRDVGIHTVCALMTEDFLNFSKQKKVMIYQLPDLNFHFLD